MSSQKCQVIDLCPHSVYISWEKVTEVVSTKDTKHVLLYADVKDSNKC